MFRIQVPNISEREQRNVRVKMSEIAASLAKHEGRGDWTSGTYVGDYTPVFIQGRKFIIVPSPVFKHLLYDVLPKATFKYPECFGKYDAQKVLKAIYDTQPMWSFEVFIEMLKRDKFAYIFEVVDETPLDKVLRIELFRDIKPNKNNSKKTEFIGGLFHTFQHFSFGGVPLSTHHSNTELVYPVDILEWFIIAFFISCPIPKNHQRYSKPGFETITKFNNKHNLEAMFYHQSTSDTHLVTRLGIRDR